MICFCQNKSETLTFPEEDCARRAQLRHKPWLVKTFNDPIVLLPFQVYFPDVYSVCVLLALYTALSTGPTLVLMNWLYFVLFFHVVSTSPLKTATRPIQESHIFQNN